jgi:nucleoid-associated protein YgaU
MKWSSLTISLADSAVTRKRKLLTATCILGLGFVLAWPFRRPTDQNDHQPLPDDRPSEPLRASNGDPIVAAPVFEPATVAQPMAPTVAHMASTAESATSSSSPDKLGFDLANHPALAELPSQASEANSPAPPTESTAKPAYTTVGEQLNNEPQASWRDEMLHIVANGDTLEKLAERYLNDAGRAMEIFDMNRDQLNNPHLLPIGVELRVPVSPDRIID